jgi:hypothetical protein
LVRDILPYIAAGMIVLGMEQMAIGIRRREFAAPLGGAASLTDLVGRQVVIVHAQGRGVMIESRNKPRASYGHCRSLALRRDSDSNPLGL